MSDIKLFRTAGTNVAELTGTSVALERSLQRLIEDNLETFLGVRFLATEFSTGPEHGGRMDTLGIDENGCPVIIEYKRSTNENVVNQGLFYLDWLMDHRRDFQWLALEKFGKDVAESVEWSAPRLLCIAGDFTRYDEHAVKQMNRNIELIRYRRYGDEFLLFELVNATASTTTATSAVSTAARSATNDRTVSDNIVRADEELRDRYEAVRAYLLALGDDVQEKTLKMYVAFKRIKNFACVEVLTARRCLLVYVKVNPDIVQLENGFTRDVRQIGHFGTGDLEITISSDDDFEKAKPLLIKSYEVS